MTISTNAIFTPERIVPASPGGRGQPSNAHDSNSFLNILGASTTAIADDEIVRKESLSPRKTAEDAGDKDADEDGDKPTGTNPETIQVGPAVQMAGAPLTIRSLNRQLLSDTSAKRVDPTTDVGSGGPAEPGSVEQPRSSQYAAGSSDRSRAESAAPSAANKQPVDSAPSPLSALTRASDQVSNTMREPARPAGSTVVTTNTHVAAVTSSAAGRPAVATVVRDGAGGPSRIQSTPAATGAAQASRLSGKMGRAVVAPSTPTSSPSRAELVQVQVARGLAAAIEKGEGTLTLRLKPEALGQLNIKVSMKDGVLSAHFEAQTREARDLLVSTTASLQQTLEAAGVVVDRIDATVATAPSQPSSFTSQGDTTFNDTLQSHDQPGSHREPSRHGSTHASDTIDDVVENASESPDNWLALGIDTLA